MQVLPYINWNALPKQGNTLYKPLTDRQKIDFKQSDALVDQAAADWRLQNTSAEIILRDALLGAKWLRHVTQEAWADRLAVLELEPVEISNMIDSNHNFVIERMERTLQAVAESIPDAATRGRLVRSANKMICSGEFTIWLADKSSLLKKAEYPPVYINKPTWLPQLNLKQRSVRSSWSWALFRHNPALPDAHCCYNCRQPHVATFSAFRHLCPNCAKIHLAWRELKVDLSGRVAVVTGARLKIGYTTCLRLLRNGATVIGTTRYPRNAIYRYQQEPDWEQIKDRFHLLELNLLDSSAIGHVASWIAQRWDTIHILINNACQTQRFTGHFYREMLSYERGGVALLRDESTGSSMDGFLSTIGEASLVPHPGGEMMLARQVAGWTPAEIDLLKNTPQPKWGWEEDLYGDPVGCLEVWRKKFTDVCTDELIETQIVNSIAPTMLIRALLTQLTNSGPHLRWVLNLTSKEGKLWRNEYHYHNNASKAALEATTATLAGEYKHTNLRFCIVDPGFVSDMSADSSGTNPIYPEDGASRTLQPIFEGEIAAKLLLAKQKLAMQKSGQGNKESVASPQGLVHCILKGYRLAHRWAGLVNAPPTYAEQPEQADQPDA
jgi:NAD(P)-dependent dehydrogenase (short-subunit alcohol dehydrogenase family)